MELRFPLQLGVVAIEKGASGHPRLRLSNLLTISVWARIFNFDIEDRNFSYFED